MTALDRLSNLLEEFEADAESVQIELQVQLAALILKGLRRLGMTQRELATRSRIDESKISPLVHGDVNCKMSTAARALHALGIRPLLTEALETNYGTEVAWEETERTRINLTEVAWEETERTRINLTEEKATVTHPQLISEAA